MKQIKSLLAFCLFYILAFTTIHAQSISFASNNAYRSVTLISGYYTKSVLVSTLLADRVGDMSPVIGTAAWLDSGRQLQCRSFMEFNYLTLPKTILDNPSTIISAELILFPLQVVFSESDVDKPSKFIVRRVLETWEDSSTLWMNQPAADPASQVVKVIKKNKKNDPVSVDVTMLVKDMIRDGNKGFLISQENSSEKSMALGQLFASPKNDDENLHPLLIITYPPEYRSMQRYETVKSASQLLWELNNRMQQDGVYQQKGGTGPVKTTEPVKITEPVMVTKPIKE